MPSATREERQTLAMEDLSALPQWTDAITRLGVLMDRHGAEAREQAAGYVARYQGRRASMVIDVVASRQRRYEAQVLPMVDAFAQTPAAVSLRALAHEGPGPGQWPEEQRARNHASGGRGSSAVRCGT